VPEAVLAAVRRALRPAQPAWTSAPVTLHPDLRAVTCLAFSPDGSTVALGGDKDHVELWDAVTGKSRPPLRGHPGRVFSLAFSPDSKTLAVGCYKLVVLWDVARGTEMKTFRGLPSDVSQVRFLSGGATLVGLSAKAMKCWDVATGTKKAELA